MSHSSTRADDGPNLGPDPHGRVVPTRGDATGPGSGDTLHMGAQATTDEGMPPSPFADGTGFCSGCLDRTRFWVAADAERPAAWLCCGDPAHRPRLQAARPPGYRPAVDVTWAAGHAGFDRDTLRGYWERPEDDPAPTLEQLRMALERAAEEEFERRRAQSELEPRELREQLARRLGAQRAVEAAKAGGRWVPLGYVVRGRHERG